MMYIKSTDGDSLNLVSNQLIKHMTRPPFFIVNKFGSIN